MFVLSEIVFNVFVARSWASSPPPIEANSPESGLKTQISRSWHLRKAWSRFCSCTGMETHRWIRILALLLTLLLPATHAQAQAAGMERVRSDSRDLRLVIASGIERSPTFRHIIDRLEQSDLIVEVQCGHFAGSLLAGRTVLLSAHPGVRYLLVEIACPMTSVPALHIVGHELRHALEIAEAPWVIDGPTLARLYQNIGFSTCGPTTERYGEFETANAIDAGDRVHHELFHQEDPARRVAMNATK
jgi:hypothetical protein